MMCLPKLQADQKDFFQYLVFASSYYLKSKEKINKRGAKIESYSFKSLQSMYLSAVLFHK